MDYDVAPPVDLFVQEATQVVAEQQVCLTDNFQINAQLQMTEPAFEFPQSDGYGEQEITAEINGQEILMSCENAGMLPQAEIKLPEPDPKVCSPVAELFSIACDKVSEVTAEVKADFLQPINVSVPTPEPAPTPQWTPSYSYNA